MVHYHGMIETKRIEGNKMRSDMITTVVMCFVVLGVILFEGPLWVGVVASGLAAYHGACALRYALSPVMDK